jgi:hypothetical protein
MRLMRLQYITFSASQKKASLTVHRIKIFRNCSVSRAVRYGLLITASPAAEYPVAQEGQYADGLSKSQGHRE